MNRYQRKGRRDAEGAKKMNAIIAAICRSGFSPTASAHVHPHVGLKSDLPKCKRYKSHYHLSVLCASAHSAFNGFSS